MRAAVVVGNPKPRSRTYKVALDVADALVPVRADVDRVVIDLADVAGQLFAPESPEVTRLLDAVAQSDLLVVASPTYKASYTGLLKAFFDRFPGQALDGVVAVPVMTGAAAVHTLANELHLRPLLVELGASVPVRGLYVTEDRFDAPAVAIAPWADAARQVLVRSIDGFPSS